VKKLKIRFSKISRVVALFEFLVLFAVLFVVTLTFLLLYVPSPAINHHFFSILSGIISVISPLIITIQIKRWLKYKKKLKANEHFIILTITGFYISIVFGSIHYTLFKIDQSYYYMDKEISNMDKERLKLNLESSEELIRNLDYINNNLRDTDSLGLVKDYNKSSTKIWRTSVDSLKVRYESGSSRMGATAEKLELFFETQKIQIYNPQVYREYLDEFDLKIHLFNKNKYILIKDLKPFIRHRRKWEDEIGVPFLRQLIVTNKDIELDLFIYQQILTALNENPNYFKAVSPFSRFFELLFALFKFLYFGVFISIIVESFKK